MCHTDVLPRAPGSMSPPPIVTGREGAGVVEAVGSGANASTSVTTWCCRSDADGHPVASRWFGQSSFATQSRPRTMPWSWTRRCRWSCGPLGCGIQTGAGSILVVLDVQPGTSLVVFGAGAVGLAAVMAPSVAGATTIIAVDLHDHRLTLARELGATHTLRGDDPELVATVLSIGILEGSADPHVVIPGMIELWREGRFPFDQACLIEPFPLSEINTAERSSRSGGTIKPVLVPGRAPAP